MKVDFGHFVESGINLRGGFRFQLWFLFCFLLIPFFLVNISPRLRMGAPQVVPHALGSQITAHFDERLLAVVVLLAEDAEHVLVIVGEHNILEVAPNL